MEEGFFVFVPPVLPQPRDDGMRVIDVVVTEAVPEVQPVQPQPEPEEPPVELDPRAVRSFSAAEQLRPRVGDWRLWVIPPSEREEPSPAELAAELNDRLAAILEAYEDSIAAMLAEGDMDWTVGKEGNKWGVSPGKIHLGPVTLPLPLYLGPHPAQQRELGQATQDWYLIQSQRGRQAIDDEFEARVKAIRERRAREEAQKKAEEDSTKG